MSDPLPPIVPPAAPPTQSIGAVIATLATNVFIFLAKPNSPLMSAVRQAGAAIGGVLAAKGWTSGDQTDQIIGLAVMAASYGLSLLRNYVTSHYLATALALPAGATPAQLTAAVKGQT